MTLSPTDRTKLTALDPNMVNGATADPALRYAVFHELYVYLDSIIADSNASQGAGAVTTTKLADGSVVTVKLADLGVTTGKVADGAIVTVKLADGSVTTVKIADGAVTSTKIAANAVTKDKIAAGAVGASQIDPALLSQYGDIAVQAQIGILSDNDLRSERSGLSGWFRDLIVNRNKKITTIGDSTTDYATGAHVLWDEITNYFTGSGDILEGITFTNRGANGNTLSNFINNTSPAGKNISDTIADKADLYILSYGINDVRLGATSQLQLTAMLDTAIQSLLKNTNGYILLRIPNSFLLDDPTSSGLVQPLSSAQTYTDLIWNAYMSLKGKYARVDVLDTQTLLFGRTCQLAANNPLMSDILHPSTVSNGGYIRIGRLISDYIGMATMIRDDLIINAQTQNSASPYLVYPKYLESRPDQYELIAQGYFVGMGSNYLDFGFDGTQSYKIRSGDIVKVGDALVYDITGSAAASGANTRILQTFSNYANNNKGIVKVFRKKGTVTAGQAFFGKSAINGTVLGAFVVSQKMRIKTIKCQTTTPIANTIDLVLKKYYQNTALSIATIHFDVNNMTATTITFDATNAPNGYYDATPDDIYTLECTSTSYTGTVSFNLTLTN